LVVIPFFFTLTPPSPVPATKLAGFSTSGERVFDFL